MDSLHFKNIPLRDVLLVTQRNVLDYSVRRTSNHSQQRLLREEILSLTQEIAQSTGILRIEIMEVSVIGGLTLLIGVPAKAGERTSHAHRISILRASHGNRISVTTERR